MHGPDPAASTTSRATTTTRRRPGAPRANGRALVGGLLVAVAAVLVFGAWAGADDTPTGRAVVARRDIGPGERLGADDVEVRSLALPDELVSTTFATADEVVDTVTLGPLSAGELVQPGSVRRSSGEGGPEFSFAVDRERALAGELGAGESVDLLATFGTGGDAETVVLARAARVLDVRDTGGSTLGSSGRLVLTVELASPDEVLDVAHASQVATVTVVRAGDAGGAGRDRTSTAAIEGRP